MYDELVLFIKIVKLGSFSKASRATGISTSSLTRKIQKLEKNLNFTILKRDTRILELSNAGKQLYDKFCDLETDVNQTIGNIKNENNEVSGLINILLPPFFALKIITPYLVDFLIKYPKITLDITYQHKVINLIKDNFDLAIIDHRPLKSTQKIKLLCRSKIIFYCYPEYMQAVDLAITQEELEENLLIGIILDGEIMNKPTYLINKKTGQKKVFTPKYRIIQHSGAHDQELARTGLTIGTGLDVLIKKDIESGTVVQILPDYYMPGFDYYLLINPEGKNARTQIFIDFINECMLRLNLDENLEVR